MANMNKNPTPQISRKPLLVSLLASIFLLVAGAFMLWQRYQILLESRQREMSHIINLVEQNIDQSLKYSYSAALSLALQIDNEGKIDNFNEVASQLVDNNPNIDAIEIVPDGVITEVYPYEENKEAVNYNILQDSLRRDEAYKAISQRRMFFGGPFPLKQGGLGIVGRLPVFIKDKFWGFSAVIIHFDNLVKQSGIRDLVGEKYDFQFSKKNPVSGEEEFFINTAGKMNSPYAEEIVLPDGEWKIYIQPRQAMQPFYSMLPPGFLLVIFSTILGGVIYNVMRRPEILAERVREQGGRLEKSERRFKTIFNQASIGMARVDSLTGKLLETNQRFQELLGYSNEELVGRDHLSISYPEDRDANTRLMEQLRNNEIREYSLKKRLVRKNGEVIWIKLSASALWKEGATPTSHIALVEDISARVKAKQELVRNEKRFRALVEHSNELILIVNSRGQAVYHSPSLKRLTGHDWLDFKGEEIFAHIHPDDISYSLELLQKSWDQPGMAFPGVVIRIQKADGNWIWVDATLTNLIEDPAIEGYVINLRDITEKKEAEINLVKSYELVMEQNKRLLNFAYIVSHNLRSHSSNLESILDLYGIEECPDEKENYVELLKKVSSNLSQSLHDLNEVVSINTKMDIEVEQVKVASYVKKVLDVLSMQIKSKNAKVKTDIAEEMELSFNPAYMESILLNFVTNALRYSHPERDPEIRILGYEKEGKWMLEVCDNGIGIDMKQHGDKVFGLYKTFSGKKDARGVGLFITKNQVEAMGGKVSVESEPGKGTCFKVIFK